MEAENLAFWERAYAFSSKWEKGTSNHPHDSGKLTVNGVTQKRYDKYRKRHGLPKRSVTEMTDEEHSTIFLTYWKRTLCDQLISGDVALFVFDSAINSGPSRSIRIMQGAARKLVIDGIPGPRTIGKLNDLSAAETSLSWLFDRALVLREAFYLRLCEKDETQLEFLEGWLNRLDGLQNEFLETA